MEPTEQPAAQLDPIPEGHPYDMQAEAAGWELWEFIQGWRERHKLTHFQYMFMAVRMLQQELRDLSLAEVAEYNKRTGYKGPT